jgi:hypothetical protein
MGRMERRRG